MLLEERVNDLRIHDENHRARAVSLYAYSDLSHVSPVVFLFLLKEYYALGTCKATAKFRALQRRVYQVLYNSPQPGPSTFVAHCLIVLPTFDSCCEGFSHLIISALRRFLKMEATEEDLTRAKHIAAKLFFDIVEENTIYDERFLVKIIQTFDVSITDIEDAMHMLDVKGDSSVDTAKAFVENYIFKLIESQSFMTAVALLEHFSIRQSGEFFLHKMLDGKQYRATEKWAAFIGKPMLRVLVQENTGMNLLKLAYDIMKKNNLVEEFPEVHRKCRESALKKLAEKGCWDIAETRTKGDRQHLEYLVQLLIYFMLKYAMEILLSESSVVTSYYFSWSTSSVAIFLACLGLTVLPVNVVVGSYISNMFEDRQILLASEIVVCLGILLSFHIVIPYTVPQYVFSGLIMFVAAEVLEGVNLSLLSRVMSSRLSRGTYNGGLLSTEAGTIARVIADCTITLAGYLGESRLLNATLLPSFLICIASIVATCRTYNTLY